MTDIRFFVRVVLCLVLLAFTAGLTGCGGPGERRTANLETLDPTEVEVPDVYHLAVGDKLRINVFGHPDVSGDFEIGGDGRITFPLLGQVEAAGYSVEELKTRIARELNESYLVNPRVSVEVLNYRPFYILGQVQKPGSYPYQSGMTVRQAVALAGGYTRRAVTSSMILIRPTEKGPVELEVTEDARVLPGDTIEIERRFF